MFDVPGDGACGAHALSIASGAMATSLFEVRKVYEAIAREVVNGTADMAKAIADEDKSDQSIALVRRAAALRAFTASCQLTAADIDLFACRPETTFRAVIVAASRTGLTTTSRLGRYTTRRTTVLILVGNHYRVAVPCDPKRRTFTEDEEEDAIEFARAHAVAWAAHGAAAPDFPDQSRDERARGGAAPDAALRALNTTRNTATAATTAAPTAPATAAAPVAVPAAGPGPASEVQATAAAAQPPLPLPPLPPSTEGKDWQTVKQRMAHVSSIRPEHAITVTDNGTGGKTADIKRVEERLLKEADVTLSAFVREWTIRSGGVLCVKTHSMATRKALMAMADDIRRATHRNGFIDLREPQPPAPSQPHPDRKDITSAKTKGAGEPDQPRGRGRSRGWSGRGRGGGRGRGRGRGRPTEVGQTAQGAQPTTTTTAANKTGAGQEADGSGPVNDASPTRARVDRLHAAVEEMQRLMYSQRAEPPPLRQAQARRTWYCRNCGAQEHNGQCYRSPSPTQPTTGGQATASGTNGRWAPVAHHNRQSTSHNRREDNAFDEGDGQSGAGDWRKGN